MPGWDTMVSKEAWNSLVEEYREAGGEDADDYTLAEMLRQKIQAVEG